MFANLNPYSLPVTGGTKSAGSTNYWIYEKSTAGGNPGEFKLLTAGTPTTISPFEAFIAKNYVAGETLKSSIGVNPDGTTDINLIDDTDSVVASKYYNLQGIEVNEPTELGVFIVKQTMKSGKEITIKVVNTK